MISDKEAQNSQNYWGQGAIYTSGKQLRGKSKYEKGVKVIGNSGAQA